MNGFFMSAREMNGFYMRCNNELKWINNYSLRPRHYDAIYVKGKLYLLLFICFGNKSPRGILKNNSQVSSEETTVRVFL